VDIACSTEFVIQLERAAWPEAAYYFRVGVNGNPVQVCSVIFEAVRGAVIDNCDGPELPFRVRYAYDDVVRRIDAVVFPQAQQVSLRLSLSDAEPPLVALDQQVVWQRAAGGCGACTTPRSLSLEISEPATADAGTGDSGLADGSSADAAVVTSDAATSDAGG
jgi:hypothetical protein